MKLEDDNFCFACGALNPCGLNLRFTHDADTTSAEFTVPKTFQGYKDIVHGGIIAAILDEAMVKATLAQGLAAITAELTVRFRSPLFVGEKAVVQAEIKHSGTRLIEAEARILGPDTKVVAEGQGKLFVTPRVDSAR